MFILLLIPTTQCCILELPNNLKERIIEHYIGKESSKSFTSKNHCYYLLFYESFDNVNNAIAREKEMKGWIKKRKLELIRSFNPEFKT